MESNYLLQLWNEGRKRFTDQLPTIKEADLVKKLGSSPNSAGFLMRHIADVELLFAKNVFGATDVAVHATTVITKHDTGEWVHLVELIAYQQQAYETLKKVLEAQAERAWNENVSTKEFGTKTKAEALGRIVTHTAWHAGQLAIILKYGS